MIDGDLTCKALEDFNQKNNFELRSATRIGSRTYANLNKTLCLKVATSKSQQATLNREAVFLRSNQKNFIPKYYDFCNFKFCSFLLMEFLHGTNFEILKPQISKCRKSQMMDRLLLNIKRVHSNGFVHCDIKPSNMIISDDEVYVIDWEFYQLIGTKICNIGLRPLSLGSTHPDLIWGRGAITAKIDEYSIMRIFDPDCSYNIHF